MFVGYFSYYHFKMVTQKAICGLLMLSVCFDVISTNEDTDESNELIEGVPRPVGRAYSLIACNYRHQAGYTCLSCHRALHCYPGNAAILVDCYGFFRYCRDGRCSRHEGDKCPDTADSSALTITNDTIAVASINDVVAEVAQASAQAQATEAAQLTESTQEVTQATEASLLAVLEATEVPQAEVVSMPIDPKQEKRAEVIDSKNRYVISKERTEEVN